MIVSLFLFQDSIPKKKYFLKIIFVYLTNDIIRTNSTCMKNKAPQLNLFKLIMITLAFIMTLRNLPMLAETGWEQIFYLILAALVFLIPVGLISAELSTGWPSKGGVYQWIKLAFGERAAFIGAWMLWVQMFFGMVTIGSFIAGMIAYLINPELISNNLFIALVIIIVYWIVTLLNLKGLKSAGLISSVGFLAGVFLPFILILVFGLAYYLGDNPVQLPEFSWDKAIPDLSKLNNLTLFAGIIFTYIGMEVSSVHASEVKNPQRNYPIAIFTAIILIMCMNIFGTFAIEIAEPRNDINLAAGIMQTFSKFFQQESISWLIPVIALMAAIGAFGQLSTWVLGPSKAMHQVASDGYMPRWWHKTNKTGIPVRFVLVQAVMISVIALVYVIVPSVNEGFFLVLILTTLLYASMYILMFASGIRLRYKYPDVKRAYRIPGKNIGMWITGMVGLITMAFVIVISFFPPARMDIGSPVFYIIFEAGGLIIFLLIPIIIYSRKKPQWKNQKL